MGFVQQWPISPLILPPLLATDPVDACRVAIPGGFRLWNSGTVSVSSHLGNDLGLLRRAGQVKRGTVYTF